MRMKETTKRFKEKIKKGNLGQVYQKIKWKLGVCTEIRKRQNYYYFVRQVFWGTPCRAMFSGGCWWT